MVPSGYGIQAFAQTWEDGGQEILDNFELVSSVFDPGAKRIQVSLPKDFFTNKRSLDNTYEVIITLAATPGLSTLVNAHLEMQTTSAASCEDAPLGSPLERTLEVVRHFNRTGETHPITHQTLPHYGTDFEADNGDNVLAVANGVIETVGFQFNSSKGTGWGYYLVLRQDLHRMSINAPHTVFLKTLTTISGGQNMVLRKS